MKFVAALLLGLTLLINCSNPTIDNELESTADESQSYDSLSAKKYGADEYGMRKYVIAILKPGPNDQIDSSESVELQKAHMANISRMAEEGKLVLAGPFWGGSALKGIYIFNVETIEEAEDLTNSDPAVKAGSLSMELHKWYGSAAVMAVNDIHNTLTKNPK